MKIARRPLAAFALSTFALFLFSTFALRAQQTFPTAAPSDPREGCYAFTKATIYADYKTRVEGATLVIRQGRVVACGPAAQIPRDAVVVDCSGQVIYPAFIDCYAADFGLPEAKPAARGRFDGPPQPLSDKKGAFAWNEALRPEFNAADVFANDPKAAEEWRKLGFATLQTFRADGISRGTGAVVALTNEREHENLLATQSAHFLSFRKGSSGQNYPSSLMGCIALIRQTYLDGQWYKTAAGQRDERNLSLDAWLAAQPLPQIFEASDKLDILRIGRIGQEFGLKYLVKTNGDEYQRLDAVKATGQPLIVGLNFPDAPDVRDPFAALDVDLKTLKHWELAPSNPARLEAAGIAFALTTNGLKEKSKFMESLRKAIEHGLSEQTALQALTFNPATFLKIYDRVGSLEPGKLASFVITDGPIFDKKTVVLQTWSAGKGFIVKDLADVFPKNLYGDFGLEIGGASAGNLNVKPGDDAPEAQLTRPDSTKTKVKISVSNGLVALSWQADTIAKKSFTLSGNIAGTTLSGRGTDPDGRWLDWRAALAKPAAPPSPIKQNPAKSPELGEVAYPFTAFGWTKKPAAGTFLVQNATVWTNERDGILTNADVLISNGKIASIGKKLPVPAGATVIDGTGKHLTAGITDEHSHIAVSRGVNEGTQESSAEVRIGDVLDSEDIDIYRQLAGGVTASHLLHGSANPIGGQTQLIKLRWGSAPEDMKFANWPGFIKFALGENVKQSNWGDNNRSRYPQTRMGVEQVFVDYFTRAQEYGKLKKSGKNYRRDLDLEALLEILESQRFITCHSYVQSEITMLMRVAERFGFKVNTFTHILEGYKVADKMARHGVGASSFADWWAYKWEVYNAIPQSPALMAAQGVTVAINSDDAEMARRLNQEAAKSVMYAGMKEEDAWKMVTLNPAKLLRVDDRTGSVRTGKDADVVLWNDNPLSIYARAEMTWVDGIKYFDRTEDAGLQEQVRAERARLIQKILAEKKDGGFGPTPGGRGKRHYHCDDAEDEG